MGKPSTAAKNGQGAFGGQKIIRYFTSKTILK
jgi:hypothetical protein